MVKNYNESRRVKLFNVIVKNYNESRTAKLFNVIISTQRENIWTGPYQSCSWFFEGNRDRYSSFGVFTEEDFPKLSPIL